nr:lysosomal-associated transmembrane protein 5 isoform X3 [Macaca fascicularis]
MARRPASSRRWATSGSNREKYLLPFLSLQIMDYLLCLLTLLGSYIELPAYLKLASRSRASPSKFPLMTLQLLDFCLSILTLCSSYMEVPTYLNFKSMNHMNYLPSQEDMPYNQFIKMMIIFSIAFITVLIFKVYMFKCVWRCYRFIKCLNSIEERSNSKMFQKVSLAAGGCQPCHSLPVPFGSSLLPSLDLGFSICKTRVGTEEMWSLSVLVV